MMIGRRLFSRDRQAVKSLKRLKFMIGLVCFFMIVELVVGLIVGSLALGALPTNKQLPTPFTC